MSINEDMPLLGEIDSRLDDDSLHVGTIVNQSENKKVEVRLRKTKSSHQVTTVTSSKITSQHLKKSSMQSLSLPLEHVHKRSSEITAKKRLKVDDQHQVTKSGLLVDIIVDADLHIMKEDKLAVPTSEKMLAKTVTVLNKKKAKSQRSSDSGSHQDMKTTNENVKASSLKSTSSSSSRKNTKSSSVSVTSSSSIASSSPGSFRITPKSRSIALENLTADDIITKVNPGYVVPVKKKKKKAGSSKSVENVVLKLRTSMLNKQASSESAPPLTAKDKFKRASKSMLRLQPSVSQDERIFFSLNPTTSSKSSLSKLNYSISSTENSAPTASLISHSLDEVKKITRKDKNSANKDLLSCPIRPGKETLIEINKGNANGLGLSIVGGKDSLLVRF